MCEAHRGQGNSVKASKRCEDSSGALRRGRRRVLGERWIGLRFLSQPMSPVAAALTRSGHTARLHFRDGWKFPF